MPSSEHLQRSSRSLGLGSPWLVAAVSVLVSAALAWSLRLDRAGDGLARELDRARRSPERVAIAFADALAQGRRASALSLSTGEARSRLQRGSVLRPLPHGEIYIEELGRLDDGRAEVYATTTLLARDGGFADRRLRVVARAHGGRWYVDEIGWQHAD